MLTAPTIALLLAGLAPAMAFSQAPVMSPVSPLDEVNLRIGTAGPGQTFPAIGEPFAMTFWTPETRPGEVKCVAPYYDGDRTFTGIRGTHWISGSCMRDYGSFTLMPESGALRLLAASRGVVLGHAEETMSPVRYGLELREQGIGIAVTGRTRAGLMAFRFQRKSSDWVVLQNNASSAGGFTAVDVARSEITGANPVRRLYAGNGQAAGFSGYFVVQFDRPMVAGGTWDDGAKKAGDGRRATGAKETGVYARFDLKPGETVRARVGTSFVSVVEARKNLEGEIPGWDLAAVEQQARVAWSGELDKVEIASATPEQRVIFYTAMYHALLHPRTENDLDGSYPKFDGGQAVMHAKGFTYYDDYSAWDTFRAVHPLFTVIDPARDLGMVRSLVAKGEQGGFLPIFPAWNSYTSEMVGDHGVAIIYDAYSKGIRGFDVNAAYVLVRKNAMQAPTAAESADGKGRRGLGAYLRMGYIPLEDHVRDAFSPHQDEQVSRTMEYAYDDALAGRFAAALGHSADAAMFAKRGENWKNVFDARVGYVRGRYRDGKWVSPFSPNKMCSWVTEAFPSQETFLVLQDIPGLIAAEGGRAKFKAKLDALFAGGFYDQGNEPSHHIAYLYDDAGEAWKAQRELYKVMTVDYTDRADGLIGNDDAGQMSAWFVFSSLGFYPVSPGLAGYEIGVPLFEEATIHLPGDKEFRITAPGAEHGEHYIAAATLNGKPLERAWLSHAEIVAGGELHFTMSRLPVKSWPEAVSR
jgi:predicted alpha-1,2-mannosidase